MWWEELGPDLKGVLPKSIKLCATKGNEFRGEFEPATPPCLRMEPRGPRAT
jgi:hypothetical protein